MSGGNNQIFQLSFYLLLLIVASSIMSCQSYDSQSYSFGGRPGEDITLENWGKSSNIQEIHIFESKTANNSGNLFEVSTTSSQNLKWSKNILTSPLMPGQKISYKFSESKNCALAVRAGYTSGAVVHYLFNNCNTFNERRYYLVDPQYWYLFQSFEDFPEAMKKYLPPLSVKFVGKQNDYEIATTNERAKNIMPFDILTEANRNANYPLRIALIGYSDRDYAAAASKIRAEEEVSRQRAEQEAARQRAAADARRVAEERQRQAQQAARMQSQSQQSNPRSTSAARNQGGSCQAGPKCRAMEARATPIVEGFIARANAAITSQSMSVFCMNRVAAEVARFCSAELREMGRDDCADLGDQQMEAHLTVASQAAATSRATFAGNWRQTCGWTQ